MESGNVQVTLDVALAYALLAQALINAQGISTDYSVASESIETGHMSAQKHELAAAADGAISREQKKTNIQ